MHPDRADQRVRAPLLGVSEALARLLSATIPIAQTESVSTMDSLGRVLASPIVSRINVPAMENSQMDGYAVASSDCTASLTRLPVSQRIAAGHTALPLEPGTAARIFTGAPMPAGADAVVMQENVTVEKSATGEAISLSGAVEAGQWVRHVGEDIRAGSTILEAGVRMSAQAMGLAASVGLAEVTVFRRVRVAIFFTGDELKMPGEALSPGAIYNSSRFTLRGLLQGLGCAVTDLGIVPDNLAATRAALREAARGHDCIITSGGVSVGEEDHVKPAVEAEGRLDLWQIAVKPGKPLAFGQVGEASFLGLPGNPVSSFVTFLLFGRPVLLKMAGLTAVAPLAVNLPAAFEWPRPDRRQEYLRVRVNEVGALELFPEQGSAVLTSTVWGHGLVENPPTNVIRRGDLVRYIPFSSLKE